MALCDKCSNMSKEFDGFRQLYDDAIDEHQTKENHFCLMYDDSIPEDIYYKKGECPYYRKRDGDDS